VTEILQPWKIISLLLGLALLIVGSRVNPAPDWDIGISLIMGGLAYMTAPIALEVIIQRNWRKLPIAFFLFWFTVDGCYFLYWSYFNPQALDMRDVNFPVSSVLYIFCGLLWLHKGDLKSFLSKLVTIE
jgi:uncharacterized protein involved in response to NO